MTQKEKENATKLKTTKLQNTIIVQLRRLDLFGNCAHSRSLSIEQRSEASVTDKILENGRVAILFTLCGRSLVILVVLVVLNQCLLYGAAMSVFHVCSLQLLSRDQVRLPCSGGA